ncbi:hypothetical protein AVEN_104571-1 [Araneus ventricosus]|uniref:Uncharacterized protein n=1 Tax=Araneus ventricosus TaxID=182803 RepID=A0A4Y2TRU0_ARAVE|nr:hypothetical protein AVEN_104571-1 [Araneus ventricosus]
MLCKACHDVHRTTRWPYPILIHSSLTEEWDKLLQDHDVVQSMTRCASDYTVGISRTDTFLKVACSHPYAFSHFSLHSIKWILLT